MIFVRGKLNTVLDLMTLICKMTKTLPTIMYYYLSWEDKRNERTALHSFMASSSLTQQILDNINVPWI